MNLTFFNNNKNNHESLKITICYNITNRKTNTIAKFKL